MMVLKIKDKLNSNALIKDTIIYFIADFIVLLTSTFLSVPIFSKSLSVDEYSIYSISQNGINLLSFVFVLGIPSAVGVLYIECKKKDKTVELLSSAIWLQFLYSSICLIVFFLTPFLKKLLWNELDYRYYYISLIISYAVFPSQILGIVYRYNSQSKKFLLLQGLTTSANIFALVLFWFFAPKNAINALFVTGITNFVAAFFSEIWILKEFRPSTKYISKDTLKLVAQCAIPFLFSYVCYFLSNRSFIVILQKNCSLSVIGIFNLLFQVASVVTIVSNSFTKALSPIIYNVEETEAYEERIRNINSVLIEILSFGSFVLFCLSKDIIYVFSKPEYFNKQLCIALVIGALFTNSSFVPSQIILAKRKFRYANIISLFSGIFTVLFGTILIKNLGLIGAGIAYCLTQFLVFIANTVIANKLLNYKSLQFPFQAIMTILLMLILGAMKDTAFVKILIVTIGTCTFVMIESKKMKKLGIMK